ncbi:MAG: amino acid ABC transporter permease [Parvibaculales bacterium]
MRTHLFSSGYNSVLTILATIFVLWIGYYSLNWMILDASWTGSSREACLQENRGACWPFVYHKFGQFIYGFYPEASRWRVNIIMFLGVLGLGWLMYPAMKHKKAVGIAMLTAYPILAFILLYGGFGFMKIETRLWGGLLITLVVASVGIVGSLPLGILLALGRRSEMPVIRMFSIGFIEFWRGVPLITVLFMASAMLPLFLPEGASFDKLLRCLIVVMLFSSAYMAEVIRGGLQAIPQGQYEAARAIGMSYWSMHYHIILPQTLRLVIPGIVNTTIGLFKDTTLISIIGLFDLLGIVQANYADSQWATPQTAMTGFLFAALIFWVFCFGMSHYSRYVERKTGSKKILLRED